ncbi:hypothetical protein BDP27DRAFT_1311353 [Rhodocollybia butyracea]|uniref:Uncharacterized protein n=1 Tax=Rhodocollybia butyracea TaxID=206335 RepID=A0A9P5Q9V8_9AGAR|nr:hypothetical protein BDP27DRAFT_1311353 [Rhodocollybia butyracea]
MSLASSGAGLTGVSTHADSASNTRSSAPTSASSSSTSSTSSIISISSPSTSSDPTTATPVSNTESSSTSASTSLNSTTALTSSSAQSPSNANSTSTISSTLTAPLTTSVQATVMSTDSNGQVHTAVIETETVFSSGSIVPTAAPVNNNISSSSSSNTGRIVGGVIGGVGGLLVILAVLFFVMKRQQRRRDLEDFDGNFDPDRIVRSGGLGSGNRDSMASSDTDGFVYAGGEKAKAKKAARRASRLMEGDGTLPNIPVDGIRNAKLGPEMQELMSASAVTSRNNLLDEEGMDDEPHSPYRTPSPYHAPLPPNSASSEGHGGIGGMMSPTRVPNSRPASMAMSMSGSATLSGHGHSPTFTGYTRPPSFYGNHTYGGSLPGSPLPVNTYGGYAMSPERSPSPVVSSASGPSGYANAPISRRRFSNGPGALNPDATRDAGAVVSAKRYSSGPLAIMNPDSHGGGPAEGLHLS